MRRRIVILAGMAAVLAAGPLAAQEYRTTPDSAAPLPDEIKPPSRSVGALRSDPEKVREGIELFKNKRYDEAARLLEAAVLERPEISRAWQALGLAYWSGGNAAAAADAWRRYRTIDPEQPQIHEWLGDLFTASGNVEEALRSYDEALRLQPTNLDLLIRRMRVARWAGHMEDIMEPLRRLCAAYPRRGDLKQELASALFANREYAEAAPLWREIRQQRPDDPSARIREIACRAYSAGDAAAQREAEAFLMQNPANIDALRLLADLAQSGGQPMAAVAFLRQMAPLIQDPKKRARVVLRIVGIIENETERDPERFPAADAMAMLEDHLKAFPDEVDILLQLGELYLQNRKPDRAAETFRSILAKLNPQNIRAERGLFEVAMLRQDVREARLRLDRIASFNPADPYLYFLRSRLDILRTDYAAALDHAAQLERAGLSGAVGVLLYHGLTESAWSEIPSVALVREQLLALREAGYRFLAAHEIPAFMASHGVPAGSDSLAFHAPERVACVTFDDARRDAMRLGTPLSREVDIPFSMHVPVGYVNEEHPFIAGWEQLRRCAAEGRWHYGSHALDGHDPKPQRLGGLAVHPLANRLWLANRNRAETPGEYLERVDAEYRVSRDRMAQNLEHPGEQTFFAYPFGDIGQLSNCNVSNAPRINLEIAGKYYQLGFIQSYYGHAVSGDNPLLYQRTEPRRGERGAELRDRLLVSHPVFLARAQRVEIAMLAGKPYLASETLAVLERDGYPAREFARLRERADKALGRSMFGSRLQRPAPPVRPLPPPPAAPAKAVPAAATNAPTATNPPGKTAKAATHEVGKDEGGPPEPGTGRRERIRPDPIDREDRMQELRDNAGGFR